jgi:pilus assembly protein CpaF
LRFICQLSDHNLPLSALNSLVTEAVDVVVHCTRTPAGPRVTEIIAVEDLAGGPEAAQFTATELFRRDRPDAPLSWTGDLPVRMQRALGEAGFDVRTLLGAER